MKRNNFVRAQMYFLNEVFQKRKTEFRVSKIGFFILILINQIIKKG